MQFAIAIPTDAESWRVVRRAEELGFARAWFYDTQMLSADALASLNKLAPGRIDFGVGTGFTGRRAMGLDAIRLRDLEEYVRVVTALLGGATVAAEIEGKRRLLRLLNPELGLINIRDPIPLWLAASAPRSRALVAKLGAGWINTAGDVAGAAAAYGEMRAAWQRAGHA